MAANDSLDEQNTGEFGVQDFVISGDTSIGRTGAPLGEHCPDPRMGPARPLRAMA